MYRYLFTDDEGTTLARVSYHFTPLTRASRNGPAEGDELIVDECIPGGFEIGRVEELTLRHNAAILDRDEAESRDAEPELERHQSPVKWGVRG